MTSEIKAASDAAPATDCANHVSTTTPSIKRLRTSSGAHEKPIKSSLSSTSRKKAGQTSTAKTTVASDADEKVAEKPRLTKASIVEAQLTREGGASLKALCEATGWQKHTCRAFLTGLRRKGRAVIRASDKDGKSIYLIAPDRSPAPPLAGQVEAESA